MLSYQVQTCKNCDGIEQVSKDLDCALETVVSKKYVSEVWLARRPSDYLIHQLTFYRSILDSLKFNQDHYLPTYCYKDITSRIKELIDGL